MSDLTGIDALAAGFRAEFGPPVEEKIALTLDPQDMSSRQLFQSVRILRGEVERLRAELDTIRADERARCVAELRTYSADLMPAAADQVIAGDDTNGFAAVRFASSMARASQLLESGDLSTPSVAQGVAESVGGAL